MPFVHHPKHSDLDPLHEWRTNLWILGSDIPQTANLYWMSHSRGINRLELYRELHLQTHFLIDFYATAGCALRSVPQVSLLNDPIDPLLWTELDVEFRKQLQSLHAEFRRCRISDHALRAEIFASVYGWLDSEFVQAWETCESDNDRAEVETAVSDLIAWIDKYQALYEMTLRESRPYLRYDLINNVLMALEVRLRDLEPSHKRL